MPIIPTAKINGSESGSDVAAKIPAVIPEKRIKPIVLVARIRRYSFPLRPSRDKELKNIRDKARDPKPLAVKINRGERGIVIGAKNPITTRGVKKNRATKMVRVVIMNRYESARGEVII